MLKASDLPDVPEDLALAVIAFAVTEAPCLDRLPGSAEIGDRAEYRARALAVLRLVARNVRKRGDTLVRSQRIGSAGVDYGVIGESFSGEHLASLRGICAALCGREVVGLPTGRFPRPGTVSDVWPELEVD